MSSPSPLLASDLPSRADLLREARRRGLAVEDVTPEEQARRAAELVKCAQDPCYWISTYARTYDPRNLDKPYVPFVLYDRQEELVEWILERIRQREPGVIEKSRDTGVSWTFVATMLWFWHFVEGFAGGLGSRKLEYVDQKGDPKTLFEKMRIILENEPAWMRPPNWDARKSDLESRLLNPFRKSSIIGEGGDHIGRGGRTSLYGVDEYNHLDKPELADAALSRNTNVVIYIGTPNGPKGIYFKRSTWKCFTFGWWDDPRRNAWEERTPDGTLVAQGSGRHPAAAIPKHDSYPTFSSVGNIVRYPWYEADMEQYRDQPFLRKAETDLDYIGTGSPRFDREFLLELMEQVKGNRPVIHELPEVSAWSGEVRIYREPEPGKFYLAVSDVAEGESQLTEGDPDWSVTHVYDCEDWEQCLVYKGRCETHSYAIDLSVIGESYNFAEICVERTGPGLATIKSLTETEIAYPCVYGTMGASEIMKHGMMTTQTIKKQGNADLASFIQDMKEGFPGFKWNDYETLEEMFYFARMPNGREQAEVGHHDDHVTCCRMAATRLPLISTRRQLPVGQPDKPKVPYSVGGRRL